MENCPICNRGQTCQRVHRAGLASKPSNADSSSEPISCRHPGRKLSFYLCDDSSCMMMMVAMRQVEDVLGVENHDASDVIFSHFDYSEHLPELMKRIKFVP
mmetsp:Transcript_2278/g.4193  ORF Transcript_2278/g.4193 Transcript_2278/m.4193 type:complete len:101 (+) Transcript_2278:1564-1866(+)